MRAKKKLIVSLLVMTFVLASMVATVALVYALTQQTIKTTLNIGYTVEGIDGTASASYTIGGVTENLVAMKGTSVIGEKLVFKAGDTEDAGNLMFPEDALALTAQDSEVVIQYTYSNTGGKHYIATMDFDAQLIYDNMKVEYSINGEDYAAQRYALVVPAGTTSRSYWIKISVDNKTKSASFVGDFNWVLNAADDVAENESYRTLTSLEIQESTTEAGSYGIKLDNTNGYLPSNQTVVFPSVVNNDPVTKIVASDLTQEQKNKVSTVIIPDSVMTIGASAFSGFANLETVTFKQNEVGTASVANGLTEIGSHAFSNCKKLKSIDIPNTVTTIGNNAFYYCEELTEMVIPDNVTKIPSQMLYNCKKIKTLTIGRSVNSIDSYFMSGVYVLESIVVASGNTTYTSEGNCLIRNSTTSKSVVLGCKNSVIPEGVKSISGFSYCTDLTQIVIPEGVTSIAYRAFMRCENLTEIIIPNSVTSLGDQAFSSCDALKNIVIGDGITKLDGQFSNPKSLENLTIGKSVSTFDYSDFYACTNLKSITVSNENTAFKSSGNCLVDISKKQVILGTNDSVIPTDGSVTKIGSHVFRGRKELTEITIPNTITEIGQDTFNSTGLTSVVIPNSVTKMYSGAFANCSNLTSVTIGSGLTNLVANMFENSNIQNITVASGNATFKSVDNCVINKTTKTLVIGTQNGVIPTDGSVTKIGNSAFRGRKELKSITIPNSVTTIEYEAFYNCSGLTSIELPSSVTSIGSSAFSGCTGLTSITVASGNTKYHSAGNCLIETESKTLILGSHTSVIPTDGSVTSIGSFAFAGYTGLTSITIPNSVTSIGDWVFSGCTGLTSIIIPDSVELFEGCVFDGCTGLTSVVIGEGVTSIEGEFNGCTNLTNVVIGSNVNYIFNSFGGSSKLKSVIFNDPNGWKTFDIMNGWDEETGEEIRESVPSSILSDPAKAAEFLWSIAGEDIEFSKY